jgi:hypothetical protein
VVQHLLCKCEALRSKPSSTKKKIFFFFKSQKQAGCQWLTPVILATQEAEIRRKPPWANSSQDPICKIIRHKKGLVA